MKIAGAHFLRFRLGSRNVPHLLFSTGQARKIASLPLRGQRVARNDILHTSTQINFGKGLLSLTMRK